MMHCSAQRPLGLATAPVKPIQRPYLPLRAQGNKRRLKYGAGARGAAVTVCSAASASASQHTRVQTLNRYGIETYDFGSRYLQQGCVGDDVAQLQSYLRSEGLMKGEDAYPGYFGDNTEAGVARWQKKHSLPSTGGFGDLARETYLQKQELKLQSVMTSSVGQQPVVVLPSGEAGVADGGAEHAGRLAAGLLLAAALIVAALQGLAWWRRQRSGAPYPDSWQRPGELSAAAPQGGGWGTGPFVDAPDSTQYVAGDGGYAKGSSAAVNAAASAVQPAAAGTSGSAVAVATPYGTYFAPKEMQQRRAALGADGSTHGGGGGAGSSAAAMAAAAKDGTYFGGTVRRPTFATRQPAQPAPWDAANNNTSWARGAGDVEDDSSTAAGSSSSAEHASGSQQDDAKGGGWDTWTTSYPAGPDEEQQQGGGGGDSLLSFTSPPIAAEPDVPPAWPVPLQPPSSSPSVTPAGGGPSSSSASYGSGGVPAGFANPNRALYNRDDLKALGQRLTSRVPASQGGQPPSGEIWVSNVRVDPNTGERINATPPPPPALPEPEAHAEEEQQQRTASPRRRRGGDYKIIRGNEEVRLTPLPGSSGAETQQQQPMAATSSSEET